jgi:hypothetical protein
MVQDGDFAIFLLLEHGRIRSTIIKAVLEMHGKKIWIVGDDE